MSRQQPYRPQSAGGEYGGRAAWNHPEIRNKYSYSNRSTRHGSPCSERSYGNSHYYYGGYDGCRRGEGGGSGGYGYNHYGGGSGSRTPLFYEHDRARENRLGLNRLDRGFVSGCRPPLPPCNSGQTCFQILRHRGKLNGTLTSFHRLGFGQQLGRTECLDKDEHEQSHHPLIHRHAPLGMPRRLGSGPEHFERAAWEASCSKFLNNNNEGIRNTYLYQDPRGGLCASARGFKEFYNNCNYSSQRRKSDGCCSTSEIPRSSCGTRNYGWRPPRHNNYSLSNPCNPPPCSPSNPAWSSSSEPCAPTRPCNLPDQNAPYLRPFPDYN